MIISDGDSVCVGAIFSVQCRSLFFKGRDLNATRVKSLLTVSGQAGLLLSQTSVCLSRT